MATKRVASLFLLLLIGVQMRGSNALSNFYYGMSCLFLEMIVRNTVNQALQKDPTLAAGLLRLHFHDCFVQVRNLLICFMYSQLPPYINCKFREICCKSREAVIYFLINVEHIFQLIRFTWRIIN
jgi:Peroxidase